MRIALIAAMSENGVIGNHNTLPWHLPEELKYFRKMTMGKPVIMGRKTFESMGNKPLPNRQNIILSHSSGFSAPQCEVVGSVIEAIKVAGDCEEVMVIGGGKIFELFLPFTSRIYLTVVHQQYSGDIYFPPIEWQHWEKIAEEQNKEFTTQIFDKRN